MKNTIQYGLLILVLVALNACTEDFESINTNPNAATIDKANPELILRKIQYEVGEELTSDLGWGLGNIVVQLVSTNNFTGNDLYNWGTYSGTWDLFYRNARDAESLVTIGQNRENPNLQGVGLVLKSVIFANLTEMYGDIPYTEALQGQSEIFQPAYDQQSTVYAGILADLALAVDLLGTGGGIDGDLMYDGDADQWKKFANSLRFRYLLRLENRWADLGINGAAELDAIVDGGIHFASNEDMAKVDYLASPPNQWPRHAGRVGGFDEKRMSLTAYNQMLAINDPRIPIYYRPVDNPDSAGVFVGVPNGLSEDNASNFNGGAKNQSRLGTRFREEPDAVDMVFMNFPELMFAVAEAAEKGYVKGGSEAAAQFYRAGIEAAMEYYGASPDASYYEQEGVAYDMNTNESKLELIHKQKRFAQLMVGLEAWYEYRRVLLPFITPGPDATLPAVPVRIQYPGNEQSLNGTNRDAAVGRQGPDEITTMMWLLK